MLCWDHHGRKTRGIINAKEVAEARQSPAAKQAGFVRDDEFFGPSGAFKVHIGKEINFPPFGPTNTVIRMAGDPVLWFEPTETTTSNLNAIFEYPDGKELLRIENNELKIIPQGAIDIKTPKSEVIITSDGRTLLHMDRSGRDQLTFLYANVYYKGRHFDVDGEFLGLQTMPIAGTLQALVLQASSLTEFVFSVIADGRKINVAIRNAV